MPTNVALVYPVPSLSSPQKSPPLSILHVGRALSEAKQRGKSDEDYNVRYFDLRYDDMCPDDYKWADVVGVSSMTGLQIRGAIDVMKKAKSFGKRTVFGGIHPTILPEQCLVEDYVDSVVVGQGEWGIIEAIHGGEKQIVRTVNLRTEDMVSPVANDTLIHFRRSAKNGDTMLSTSRGCPYSCSFCFIVAFYHKQHEPRWSKVDLEQWKRDIIFLRDNVGMNKLEHSDDWVGPVERLFEILEFLKDKGIKYRPSIRAHQINDDVAKRMKSLGVEHLSVGIETASPRILKLVHKGNDLSDLKRCVESLAKHKLWPLLYYITNFPTETKEETNQTLGFADWAYNEFNGKVTQNFYSYLSLPGSELWDLVDKTKIPSSLGGWSNFSIHKTSDKQSSNLYHIAGLNFHREKGDKTDRNFPGWRRIFIYPFEAMASLRWRKRWFTHFELESWAIESLLKWASLRYERRVRRDTKLNLSDVDAMDWGVRENRPDIGNRGEFLTGEIDVEDRL